jgi:serralysin
VAGVLAINSTGNQDIDGILWGWKWDTTALTYSFPTSATEYTSNGYAAVNGFAAFNAVQQNAVKSIFANLSSFTNLTFTQSTTGVAVLRFGNATTVDYSDNSAVTSHTGLHQLGNSGTAEANPPELSYNGAPPASASYAQGDGWFTAGNYSDPTIGSFEYAAGIMHETGHNLGLKHGHITQGGHGVLFPTLPADHNSYEYSVMTYSQFPTDVATNGDNAKDHPTTYMQDDIAALQYLYGANYGATAQNANTVYSWSPTTGEEFVNGVGHLNANGEAAPADHEIFLTIWDGGGVDTYNFSNYTTNMSIDLSPGGWTVLDTSAAHLQRADLGNNGEGGPEYFARGNIANAQIDPNKPAETASLIENAVGGSGNDTISGNAAGNSLNGGGGNDMLFGKAGNDVLTGGAGTNYLDGGAGADSLIGAGGVSCASYVDSAAGLTINLLAPSTSTGDAAGDSYSNVHNVLGSSFSDTIVADNAGDRLYGGLGNDTIIGGSSADAISGGAGRDFLIGGGGADQFIYQSASEGGDTIDDFSKVQGDTIWISHVGFGGGLAASGALAPSRFVVGSAATSSAAEFVFSTSTDTLTWDSNGSAVGGTTAIATLLGVNNLAASDIHLD